MLTIFGYWCALGCAVVLGWYVVRNPKPYQDDASACTSCGARGYARLWCIAEDCSKDRAQ